MNEITDCGCAVYSKLRAKVSMRLLILSDLHLEFGPFDLGETEFDVAILAGDIHTKRNSIPWIKEAFHEKPIIYVAGNHEFYGAKWPGLIEKLRALVGDSEIHILENEVIEIGSITFFGATLWTDLELYGNSRIGTYAALTMNDYKKIRHSTTYRKLKPIDTRARHIATVRGLKEKHAASTSGRFVVVTHHAPSPRSLPKQSVEDPVNCGYRAPGTE